jgi:2,3,4,5-tetrahydropyridine-2,6-dicarboxylate N-acetyltransferase
MNEFLLDPYEIAKYIKQATKTTPIKATLQGRFESILFPGVKCFGTDSFKVLFGEATVIESLLAQNKDFIDEVVIESSRRNSAIPLLDITSLDARIEPGAIIREFVSIGSKAVIMMGAVINIGAVIGSETMIDMNAVVGARGQIGSRCHIGAGAVIAGVLEPPSKLPVIIEDGVLVGANAVVLEGVRVGKNSVVAAGAIVTQDVPEGVVVAGSPAKIIKQKDEKTEGKTQLLNDLRK